MAVAGSELGILRGCAPLLALAAQEFDDIGFGCRLVQQWDTERARSFRMSPSWHPRRTCREIVYLSAQLFSGRYS